MPKQVGRWPFGERINIANPRTLSKSRCQIYGTFPNYPQTCPEPQMEWLMVDWRFVPVASC